MQVKSNCEEQVKIDLYECIVHKTIMKHKIQQFENKTSSKYEFFIAFPGF